MLQQLILWRGGGGGLVRSGIEHEMTLDTWEHPDHALEWS
jgi:hypothetical protein